MTVFTTPPKYFSRKIGWKLSKKLIIPVRPTSTIPPTQNKSLIDFKNKNDQLNIFRRKVPATSEFFFQKLCNSLDSLYGFVTYYNSKKDIEKLLRDNSSLSKLNIHRVTFNEITKNAVLDSLKEPREIDENLVNAYLARRALDFLVGFTLSPVLWRKLPGSKSAGRVQSVALRIISERELEIEKFIPQEYWSLQGEVLEIKGSGSFE